MSLQPTNEELLNLLLEHVSDNKRQLFEEISADRTRHITVVLENIFQPHNAAAVLRSCDCFGVQDVHIIENENKYEPNKEIDVGSSKWLNLHKYNEKENNTVECIQALKEKGYQVIASTPHTDDCLINELSIDQPTALLFGTEMEGLTPLAMEHADGFVKLPMYGFTESFNISVSVALALFNVTERMRADTSINWQLSEEEIIDLKLEWVKKVVRKSDKVEQLIRERYGSS